MKYAAHLGPLARLGKGCPRDELPVIPAPRAVRPLRPHAPRDVARTRLMRLCADTKRGTVSLCEPKNQRVHAGLERRACDHSKRALACSAAPHPTPPARREHKDTHHTTTRHARKRHANANHNSPSQHPPNSTHHLTPPDTKCNRERAAAYRPQKGTSPRSPLTAASRSPRARRGQNAGR